MSREKYLRWYESKGEDYNKRRRTKYRSNPDYREKCLQNAREYREKITKGHKPIRSKDIEWKDSYITVYSLGHVAAYVDRARISILRWEENGLIPVPVIPGKVRWYTENQCNLIGKLALVFNKYGNVSNDSKGRVLAARVAYIKSHWEDDL